MRALPADSLEYFGDTAVGETLHCLQPLVPSSAELPLCVRWERLLQAPCSWVPWLVQPRWRLDRTPPFGNRSTSLP